MMGQDEKMDISQFSDDQILQFINQNPELKKQYEQFSLKAKQQPTTFKTKPLTNSEYLKLNDIKEFLDEEGGMMIEPTPHFVLKSFDENGEKIFFNVTSHSVIDKPEEKQLVDYNNEAGIRVPMSVGSIREDHDVKGDICKVIDLVVNGEVAKNLQDDVNLRQFFCSLVQTYILQKYKIKLQDKFISLKMKYKGKSIQFQRVKGKKPPKVEIIDQKENEPKSTKLNQNDEEEEDETDRIRNRAREQYEKELIQSNNQQPQESIQEPEWDLIVGYCNKTEEIYDGDLNMDLLEYFRFEINLPLIITGKAIKIKTNNLLFQMTLGRMYKLGLKFPREVDSQTISAQFNTEKRILNITAQYKIQQPQQTTNEEMKVKNVQIELDNSLIFDIV